MVIVTRWVFLTLFAVLLGACAGPEVLNIDNATVGLEPGSVARQEDIPKQRVVWGGVIVAGKNLPTQTQLEVLAYPLRKSLQPDTDDAAIGRFIVLHDGYLEMEDYAPGRKLTLVGVVKNMAQHKVGEMNRDVPLLHSEELHLWPVYAERTQPQFSFGLGISIGN